jgi:(S)-ureidoglycine aminohydrolase
MTSMTHTYYAPHGGLPPQTDLITDRAVFTEAYAVIPKGVSSPTSSPASCRIGKRRGLDHRAAAVGLRRDLLAICDGGAARRRQRQPGTRRRREGVLFVVEGSVTVTIDGKDACAHARRLCLSAAGAAGPCATRARKAARFHWVRKAYEYVDGLDKPEPLFSTRTTSSRTRCLTPTGAGRRRASSIPPICATTCMSPSSPSSRAASSPSPRRMSWSTGSTCSKARRSTG